MKQDIYEFKYISEENGKMMSHSIFLPPDGAWNEPLTHFAHFLEGIGYSGVVKKLDDNGLLDDPLWNFKGSDVE